MTVRVLSVESCARELPTEDQARLAELIGATRSIVEFDRAGFLWLPFNSLEWRADFASLPNEVVFVQVEEGTPVEPADEELAAIRAASPAELAIVDRLLLEACLPRWQKVAKVVGNLLDRLERELPQLPTIVAQVRMLELEHTGEVEIQGDVMAARQSEVRLSH